METIEKNNENEITNNKKNNKIKILIPVFIAIFVIVTIIIIIALTSGNKISVEDYIVNDIKFSGYDGHGKIETLNNDLIDYDSLYTALEIKQPGLESILGADNVLKKYIDISCDSNETENLKNNDTVTYKINVNYDAINNLGDKKLSGDETITVDFKVSGLGEITSLDPFEPLENVVINESYSSYTLLPQLSNKIGNYNILTETSNLSYEIDLGMNNESDVEKTASVDFSYPNISENNIKIGDKITVTLDIDVDNYVNEYGILFTQTSKEYKVITASYLTDKDDISDTIYQQLKVKFEKYISSLEDDKYNFLDIYFYNDKGILGYNTTSIVALCRCNDNTYVSFTIFEPMIASNDKLVDIDSISKDVLKYNSVEEFKNHWKNFGGYSTETTFEKINAK